MGFSLPDQRFAFAALSLILVSGLLQSGPLCNASASDDTSPSEVETRFPEFFALDVSDLMKRFAGPPTLEVGYRLDRLMREVGLPAQDGYIQVRMPEYSPGADNALLRRIARYVILLRHRNNGGEDYQAYVDFVARLARVSLSLELRDQEPWARAASEALEHVLRYAELVADCVPLTAECMPLGVPISDGEQIVFTRQCAASNACATVALRAALNHPEA